MKHLSRPLGVLEWVVGAVGCFMMLDSFVTKNPSAFSGWAIAIFWVLQARRYRLIGVKAKGKLECPGPSDDEIRQLHDESRARIERGIRESRQLAQHIRSRPFPIRLRWQGKAMSRDEMRAALDQVAATKPHVIYRVPADFFSGSMTEGGEELYLRLKAGELREYAETFWRLEDLRAERAPSP